MTELIKAADAILRLKENENRLDIFVNGDEEAFYETNTEPPEQVSSVRNFLAELTGSAENILSEVLTAASDAANSAELARTINKTNVNNLPAFIDTFADIRSIPSVPANIATYQNGSGPNGGGDANEFILTISSGVAGVTSVVVSETEIVSGIGSSYWPCAVEYVDGSLDFNVIIGGSGSTVNLKFPLAKAGAFISPVWSSANGQHMTKRGYRAFADLIYKQSSMFTTATKFLGLGAFTGQPPVYQQLFKNNAALASYGSINVNNVVSGVVSITSAGNCSDPNGPRLARTAAEPCGVRCGVHATGHGFEGSINIGRRRAFLETHVYTTSGASSTPSVRGNATINVYGNINGTEFKIHTKNFSDFMERVLVSLNDFDSIRIEVLAVDNAAYFIDLMDTRCWIADANDVPLIGKNSKIVTMGDSWFAYYSTLTVSGAVSSNNGAFSQRLQELIESENGTGTVINKSKGGMTTKWALAWFDSYVLAEKPSQVIFNFFTNDALMNLATATFIGPDGSEMNNRVASIEEWRANIAQLEAKCEVNGIQPIFILPSGTASVSQAQTQLTWRRSIRQGFCVDSPQLALSTELADTTAFINKVGKAPGKAAVVGSVLYYAQGSLAADSWRNPQNERLANLEIQTYDFSAYDVNANAIGTDSNADGWSNGVTFISVGTTTGSTFTPSISNLIQLLSSTYTLSGSTGYERVKFPFTTVIGHDYLLIAELAEATPNCQFYNLGSFGGTAVSLDSSIGGGTAFTDSLGNAVRYWKFASVAITNPYYAVHVLGSRSSLPITYITGMKRINLIDLTNMQLTLGINANDMSSDALFNLINSAINLSKTYYRIKDTVTGGIKKITVANGAISII